MRKGWIAAIVATLVIGLGLGVLGGVLLFDDDDSADSPDTATATATIDCDEAQAVVDARIERVDEINESETRDAGYYAALIVEQRTITYVMDVGASCFSLADRAGNVGLLEGIHALLDSLSGGAARASGAPTPETPTSEAPADSSGIDE